MTPPAVSVVVLPASSGFAFEVRIVVREGEVWGQGRSRALTVALAEAVANAVRELDVLRDTERRRAAGVPS